MLQKMKGILAMAGALVLVGAGCAQNEAMVQNQTPTDTSPIKIGWVGPLTGDAATLGQDALKGAQMAVKEVNDAGGVNGRMLELVPEDGKCNPKDAAQAGNKLINVDKVSVINGTACSGEMTAITPMAEENKVVMVGYCASAPSITDAGDYIFRTYPSDAYQGKFGAEYVFNKLGKKKVATFAVLGDYGTGIKMAFEKSFKELGGEVVSSQDYEQSARDFRSQLAKVKDSKPEALYFVGYTEATIAALKQAKEIGLNVPIFGGDALDDPKIHANSFAEGMMYTVGANNASADWQAKIKAFGGNPTVCAPRSYDNIKLIADVVKQVGTDPTKIKEALYKVKDFPGANGLINFDANGDPITAQYEVKVVKNGKAEVVK